MTLINSTIRTLSMDDASQYGYVHQQHQNCISYRLTKGVVLYVLTINSQQNYISFDAYMGQEQLDSIFLQGRGISEMVCNDWQTLTLIDLTSRLIQLFE
ncbi:MAG: hypothetical protein NWF07_05140 [Candidatus Bathyarchaeota archaeon]|nr:hypothetical protein [Candidatus Bathyarchaeota archaeon]